MNPAVELQVSIERQTVEVKRGGEIEWSAPVSTSAYGTGFMPGSYRTPTGRFCIAEKIGDGLPLGARLVGRVWTGEVWTPGEMVAGDWILTRILWLDGLEEKNRNTKARFIYFHGTNQEDKIGTPSSHGCIRLRNADMVELFDRTPLGSLVTIE